MLGRSLHVHKLAYYNGLDNAFCTIVRISRALYNRFIHNVYNLFNWSKYVWTALGLI